MATSFSTLRNNRTTSNQVFDSQVTIGEEEDNNENEDNSIVDCINNEFGALSEEDNDDDEPSRKKAKMVKKKLEFDSVKKVLTQPKGKRKSAGVELAQKMKNWREHREKEYEQQELSKLSLETQVMRKFKEVYADEMKELNFQEYKCLILLLCNKNKDFAGCTRAEYFLMIEEGGPKFRDELMELWFEDIKA